MIHFKNALQSFVLSSCTLLMVFQAHAASIDAAIVKGEVRANSAKAQQVKIDKVDSQTKSIERDYRALVKEVEGLEVYVQQLNKQLAAQESELAQIDESIKQVTLIERQITPLMLKMIEAIVKWIGTSI